MEQVDRPVGFRKEYPWRIGSRSRSSVFIMSHAHTCLGATMCALAISDSQISLEKHLACRVVEQPQSVHSQVVESLTRCFPTSRE